MQTLYPKLITDALATVNYAGTKKNLIESEMLVDDVSIDGMKVSFTLLFPKETDPFLKSTLKAAEAAIHYYVGKEVEVTIKTEFKTKPRPKEDKYLTDLKIIAVSSGKGVSASLRCRQTSLLPWRALVIGWGFLTQTSSDLPCQRCSDAKMHALMR